MILAIDIGGTKTLVALADKAGKVTSQQKFPTPEKYKDFLREIENIVANFSTPYKVTIVAAPGKIDRKNGVGLLFGNLKWKNVPLQKDLSAITKTPVLIDNDANLAGLGETIKLKPRPHKCLYLTFSTGIGDGIITDGIIDPDFADSEAGKMLFEHNGELQEWEAFGSGRAIVAKYGKMASEINEPETWNEISKSFSLGIVNLCSIIEPDLIIIGGSVGTHFQKYSKFLINNSKNIANKMVTIPPIIQAQHPETAVIYGCVELAKQKNLA